MFIARRATRCVVPMDELDTSNQSGALLPPLLGAAPGRLPRRAHEPAPVRRFPPAPELPPRRPPARELQPQRRPPARKLPPHPAGPTFVDPPACGRTPDRRRLPCLAAHPPPMIARSRRFAYSKREGSNCEYPTAAAGARGRRAPAGRPNGRFERRSGAAHGRCQPRRGRASGRRRGRPTAGRGERWQPRLGRASRRRLAARAGGRWQPHSGRTSRRRLRRTGGPRGRHLCRPNAAVSAARTLRSRPPERRHLRRPNAAVSTARTGAANRVSHRPSARGAAS